MEVDKKDMKQKRTSYISRSGRKRAAPGEAWGPLTKSSGSDFKRVNLGPSKYSIFINDIEPTSMTSIADMNPALNRYVSIVTLTTEHRGRRH
jgi:hypothetical protein